nr:MAG TPA: hypothetical protein [Inoviridae sp.]
MYLKKKSKHPNKHQTKKLTNNNPQKKSLK